MLYVGFSFVWAVYLYIIHTMSKHIDIPAYYENV